MVTDRVQDHLHFIVLVTPRITIDVAPLQESLYRLRSRLFESLGALRSPALMGRSPRSRELNCMREERPLYLSVISKAVGSRLLPKYLLRRSLSVGPASATCLCRA